MNILSVNTLSKYYRKHFWSEPQKALDNLSFSIKEGCITGFLGANGSGKSTCLKAIMGLITCDSGNISWRSGEEPSIGFLPEGPSFPLSLSADDILEYYISLSSLPKEGLKKQKTELLQRLQLLSVSHRALKHYSKGMLQKVGLIQAFLGEPSLVIMDEPLLGLDPESRSTVRQLIMEYKQRGSSIFFSSHLLYDVESLSEQLVIIDKGSLAFQGALVDLKKKTGLHICLQYQSFEGGLVKKTIFSIQELQLCLGELEQKKGNLINISSTVDSLRKGILDKL